MGERLPYQVMPDLSPEDYQEFYNSIQEAGEVYVPVVLDLDGNVIDGHNRKRIATELGIPCPVNYCSKELDDQGKRTLARVLNLQRRHLTQAQRRHAIADALREEPEKSDRQHARALGVSHHTVASVREELEGTGQIAQLEERVGKDGKTRRKSEGGEAMRQVEGNLDTSREDGDSPGELSEPSPGELPGPMTNSQILARAKEIRAEQKAKRREERIEQVAHRAQSPALDGFPRRYPIVVADPPWVYQLEADAEDYGGHSQHYPSMEVEEICALPVGQIAAPDAVLYLWCTGTTLADGAAHQVARAWGFTPVTTICWDKFPGAGPRCRRPGYWTFQDAEYLLICKRGDIPTPGPSDRMPSPIREETSGEHSSKPVALYHSLVIAYPGLAKIDLFAREPRRGWAVWGNEVGCQDDCGEESRSLALEEAQRWKHEVRSAHDEARKAVAGTGMCIEELLTDRGKARLRAAELQTEVEYLQRQVASLGTRLEQLYREREEERGRAILEVEGDLGPHHSDLTPLENVRRHGDLDTPELLALVDGAMAEKVVEG